MFNGLKVFAIDKSEEGNKIEYGEVESGIV